MDWEVESHDLAVGSHDLAVESHDSSMQCFIEGTSIATSQVSPIIASFNYNLLDTPL